VHTVSAVRECAAAVDRRRRRGRPESRAATLVAMGHAPADPPTARWQCARFAGGFLAALVTFALAPLGTAAAQTDEIQVYDAAIVAPGVFVLTWHNNFTPSGPTRAAPGNGVIPNHALNGVTEWAYGVTDWFEAGLYLPLYTVTSGGALLYDGMKLRVLFVSPGATARRFFYGINFEFSVNSHHWDPDRYTSEIRPILGWHLGRLDLIFNPILDSSYKGVPSLDFAPATRVAFNFANGCALAAEEYDDFGPLRHSNASARQSHQLFAVFDYRTAASVTLEAGLGFGLTGSSDHRVIKFIFARDLR
jgi:hypothetical protein